MTESCSLTLGWRSNSVAVGSWGFECVFPALNGISGCIEEPIAFEPSVSSSPSFLLLSCDLGEKRGEFGVKTCVFVS